MRAYCFSIFGCFLEQFGITLADAVQQISTVHILCLFDSFSYSKVVDVHLLIFYSILYSHSTRTSVFHHSFL